MANGPQTTSHIPVAREPISDARYSALHCVGSGSLQALMGVFTQDQPGFARSHPGFESGRVDWGGLVLCLEWLSHFWIALQGMPNPSTDFALALFPPPRF